MSVMHTVPGGAGFRARRARTARFAKRPSAREPYPGACSPDVPGMGPGGGGEGAAAVRAPDIVANESVSAGALIAGLGHNGDPPLDVIPRLPRLLYEPAEAEELLTVSHATLYRLIRTGRLDARKIGSKTVITAASIERFISKLPPAGVLSTNARPIDAG
jgi:excisionase family DNA binding protein